VLLAINYGRLGDSSSVATTLVSGSLATVALMTLGFFLPDNFPAILLPIATTVAMRQLAAALQGPTLDRHLALGGQKASAWSATGIGLVCLILLVAAIFGTIAFLPDAWFTK